MALAAAWRRGPAGAWRGLQAAALVAERLQLQLAPSICSELEQQQQQLWQGGGRAACSSSAWQAAPSWPRAACSGCSFAAGPALVRWHSTSAGRQKAPEKDSQEKQAAAGGILEAFSRAGWSRREVLNIPNGLSMLRLLSGPVIASWILAGQWELALPALAVSGATDWADGYVAKNYNQRSVLGSYLDPLADKTLMCSVIAAMGYTGALSWPMVGLILGRDVLIIAGVFAARAQMLGWRWPGAGEFFRLSGGGGSGSGSSSSGGAAAGDEPPPAAAGKGAGAPDEAPAAPFVEPLYISKVNTCFQLGLVGVCMARAWLGFPGEDVVWWAASGTAVTTVWSTVAYVRAFLAGNMLQAGAAAGQK